jgi:hypothetical protein
LRTLIGNDEDELHLAALNNCCYRRAKYVRFAHWNGNTTELPGAQTGGISQIQLHQKRSAGYISRWRDLADGSLKFIRNNVDRKLRAKSHVVDYRFGYRRLKLQRARVLDFEQSFAWNGEIADIGEFA